MVEVHADGWVSVVWSQRDGRGVAETLLREEAGRVLDVEMADLNLTRVCPACGSSSHGRPELRLGSGPARLHVSISRTGPITVVAATPAGPVGVDVEANTAAGFRHFDTIALHPLEQATTSVQRTVQWVRKESLLKATGHGLMVEASAVRLSDPPAPPRLLEWIGDAAPAGPAWMYDAHIAQGFVVAVTVLADRPPALMVRREEEEEPTPIATP